MIAIENENDLYVVINGNETSVVKLSAGWCNPCKVLGDTITNIERTQPELARFAEVDVDKADEDFVDSLNVRSVPVLLFYKNGELKDRFNGLMTEQALIDKIEKING